MFGAQSVKSIKNYKFYVVVRFLQDEVDKGSRSSCSSAISHDHRCGQNAQTFNCGRMLCQTGEGCGRLVLHCVRRRVQKFENAANPSRLDVDAHVRLPHTNRMGHLPYESNHPCSPIESHLLSPFAVTHRDSQFDHAPALRIRQPLA